MMGQERKRIGKGEEERRGRHAAMSQSGDGKLSADHVLIAA